MFRTAYLLLAAVCVVSLSSLGQAEETHPPPSIGSLTGVAHSMAPAYLEAGKQDFIVTIPTDPRCGGQVRGVLAYVKDNFIAPDAYFTSFTSLVVHRHQVKGLAEVDVVVYCDY